MENEKEQEQETTTEEKALPEIHNERAQSDFLDQLFGRMPSGMDALSGGKSLIKSREVTFLFDGSAGAPGIFTDSEGNYLDVMLTVRTLSSAQEIEALSALGEGNIMGAPYALAKQSLVAVEGKPLKTESRELIWEALGSTGRQLVLMAFQQLGGGASESAMGKYRASFTIS